ncbi:hypothetical protein [Bacillus paralicheniformis]
MPHYRALGVYKYFTLLVSVISLHRGCDVDKPRNLAKSVVVEE